VKRWLAPRLLALHLFALAVIAGCVLMGLWQLGVYGSKHDDASAAVRTSRPVPLLDVWGPDDAFRAGLDRRPVWIRGEFIGRQFLIQRAASRYWLVAPLRVEGTKSLLPIVRGWTNGRHLPHHPVGTVTFRAKLQPGEDAGTSEYDPVTASYGALSIPQLANVLHRDLFSGYALTDAAGITGGLQPVAPPEPHVSWTVGLRNLAYALQWWVFGMFAGFMWWRMANDAVAVAEDQPDDRVTA
jgi:cytochrome oxidase assembly protein ShyY1